MDPNIQPLPDNDNSAPDAMTNYDPGQVVSPSAGAAPAAAPEAVTPAAPEAMATPPPVAPEPTVTGQPQPTVITPTAEPSQPQGVFQPPSLVISSPPESPKRRFGFLKSRKGAFILVLVLILLLGGSAAAYFGYYVPNQPQNIWNKALVNTGKGYDKLTTYATQTKNAKGLSINGSFKASGGAAIDGTISGTTSNQNSDIKGDVSAVGLKINYEVRTIQSAGNTPDVYFKVDGLQGLGDLIGAYDSELTPTINSINGQWYFIDHTLFDQFAAGTNSQTQLTANDVNSILGAIGSASKQYVFTNDTSKQVIVVKQNLGKETQDGRTVYHYKIGYNKANLKSYVSALCQNLKNSSLKKFFNNDEKTMEQTVGCDTAAQNVDKLSDSGTADAWVDMHTKLIHKIRFSDKSNANNYFDIGQDYQGGSSFPFTIGFNTKDDTSTSSGSLKIVLNTQTNEVTFSGQAQINDSGSDNETVTFNLTLKPNNSPVNVQKPDGAKNILQLLNDLGFPTAVQGQADDTRRQTDINAIQGQVEAYNAENGYYPTLANINDPVWLSANLKGLGDTYLQDPDGTSTKLASAPAANVYAYQPTPSGCNNTTTQCTGYTLTATLSDGSKYAKTALGDDSNALSG